MTPLDELINSLRPSLPPGEPSATKSGPTVTEPDPGPPQGKESPRTVPYVSADLDVLTLNGDLYASDVTLTGVSYRVIDRHWFSWLRRQHGDQAMDDLVSRLPGGHPLEGWVEDKSNWPDALPYAYAPPCPAVDPFFDVPIMGLRAPGNPVYLAAPITHKQRS